MSKKRERVTSLSEKLFSLIQTKPLLKDCDDEDFTTVDEIAVTDNDSNCDVEDLDIPKLRKTNKRLLDEEDGKYSGKEVSRKDLKNFESDSRDSDENVDNLDKNFTHSFNATDDVSSFSCTNSSENESETESDCKPGYYKEENIKCMKDKLNDGFNNEIFTRAIKDIEKGKDIKNQLLIWDFLLDCRMKFQRCLFASNQFPNHKNFLKFNNKGGVDFQNSLMQCKKSINQLLFSLLSLQQALLNSNRDFLSLSTLDKPAIKINNFKKLNKEKLISSKEKLKTLTEISEEIQNRHKTFENYRNDTIQKWNDKTRVSYISSKNFSAFEQSTLKQIEHVLLDKPRLIKRTQTKRSIYHILGNSDDEPSIKLSKHEAEDFASSKEVNLNRINKEIFDDDDFYHQLLSELVKRKANDVTDPVQLGKQWMQLQKVRSKMKKTVDVKASKGRKVRFVVHPKLVNFMMPINNTIYNEESRTELFNSLFGKNKK